MHGQGSRINGKMNLSIDKMGGGAGGVRMIDEGEIQSSPWITALIILMDGS